MSMKNFDRNPDFDNLRCDNKHCIRDIIKQIDQNQKEAAMQNQLDGCEAPLIGFINDTRPISFTLCNGNTFSARLDTAPATYTDLFRVEELRGNCVVLRLLNQNETITCTEQTCILDLCCVCAIQCFDPITCQVI